MAGCAAQYSFCSALIVKKLHAENNPTLLDKISNLEATEKLKEEAKTSILNQESKSLRRRDAVKKGCHVMASILKRKAQNLAIIGAGQTSGSLNEMCHFVFKRDFSQLVSFTGVEKIGVIFAPPTMISKNPINLFPDKLDAAKKMAKDIDEGGDELQKDLYRAQREYSGYKPEFDLLQAIREALKDCDGVIVIHSSELRNPDLQKLKLHQEFDVLILDSKTITVFSIEAKKTLGFHYPGKKKADSLNVAEKVGKQLSTAHEYLTEWFGGSLSVLWTFKPMIYCTVINKELENLCQNCDAATACGQKDFKQKFMSYRKSNMKTIEEQMQVVDEFKLLARFLLFGLAARELPTVGNLSKKVNEYMEKVGEWQTIKLWCFLTPNQMEILDEPYVVFCSGWGGGKTTTGIEAVKRWSDQGMSVLILLNALMTDDTDIILLYHLKNILKNWKPEEQRNGKITVAQIDFDNDSLEKLTSLASTCNCVFIDEYPGTLSEPTSDEYQMKLKKSEAIFRHKYRAWISISNYDKENDKDLSEMHEATAEFFSKANLGHSFNIFKGLNLNLRNPSHIKDSVDESSVKFDEQGKPLNNETIQALNMAMTRPPNFIGNIAQDPKLVLEQVLRSKSMRAIIVTRNQDDACTFGSLLQNLFNIDAVILSKWTSTPEEKEKVEKWLDGEKYHVLVTSKKLVNGFECETIISVEDVEEDVLGDVISRATSQFVGFQDFKDFLMDANLSVCNDGAMDFFDGFASPTMRAKLVEVLWSQLDNSSTQSLNKDYLLKGVMEDMDERYPSGLMKVIFDTVSYTGYCIHLISTDLLIKEQKCLAFCSGLCNGCQMKLTMACSVTPTFLLLMNFENGFGPNRSLPSVDLYQCLSFIRGKQYGYTIERNTHETKRKILVNDCDSFLSAIERVYKTGSAILFVTPPGWHNLCKALNVKLRSKELKDEFLFKNAFRLSKFLKDQALQSTSSSIWRESKSKHFLVIDFTDDVTVFQSVDPSLRHLFDFFKCPLTSSSTLKAQEIIASNPKQLCECVFNGVNQIKNDPLNLLELTSVVSRMATQLQLMFFLEFGLDFEQNFRTCLLPVLQNLELTDANNIAQFESFVSDLWKSMKNWNVKTTLSKKSIFKKIFQKLASIFQLHITVVTVAMIESLADDDTEVEPKQIRTFTKSYKPRGHENDQFSNDSVLIIHIFDDKLEGNGFFLTSPRKACKILVMGGDRHFFWATECGTATLIHTSSKCTILFDMPNGVKNSAGGLLSGLPVVCGGVSFHGLGVQNKCITHDGYSWIHFATMKEKREWPSSTVLFNRIWVSGGSNDNGTLKTSEFITIDGYVSHGPDLPETLKGHATIQIKDSVLIIGGHNGGKRTKATRFFDSRHLSFQKNGPPMNVGRSCHGCCIVQSPNHEGRNVIIIAGGEGTPCSVELWDWNKPGSTWQKINDLPVEMPWRPAIHPDAYGDGVFIIYQQYSFKLTFRNGEYIYKKLDWQLKWPRTSFCSIMIPYDHGEENWSLKQRKRL